NHFSDAFEIWSQQSQRRYFSRAYQLFADVEQPGNRPRIDTEPTATTLNNRALGRRCGRAVQNQRMAEKHTEGRYRVDQQTEQMVFFGKDSRSLLPQPQ